jgi:catechol 2,3-dioxygenase-like lactoylglutathione lyase family enzyme
VSGVVDHVGIRVSDLQASRRMYEAALAELGFSIQGEGEFEGDAYMCCSAEPAATTSASTLSAASQVAIASQ